MHSPCRPIQSRCWPPGLCSQSLPRYSLQSEIKLADLVLTQESCILAHHWAPSLTSLICLQARLGCPRSKVTGLSEGRQPAAQPLQPPGRGLTGRRGCVPSPQSRERDLQPPMPTAMATTASRLPKTQTGGRSRGSLGPLTSGVGGGSSDFRTRRVGRDGGDFRTCGAGRR